MKSPKKKILFITTTNINSSSANANRAIALLNSLVDSGFDITVVHATLNNQLDHPKRNDVNFPIVFFADKSKSRVKNLFLLFYVMFKTLNFIRKNKQALIYSYGFHVFDVVISSLSKLFFRTPVIREFTEHPSYNNKIGFLTTIKIKIAFHFSNHILVISKNLKDFVATYTKKPISILNMVVDAERFNIKTQNTGNLISYCGTIESEKDGIFSLFKAFQLFMQNDRFKEFKLQIIADTRNKVKYNNLVHLATQLGILESIIFTGKVASSEMPSYLSNSKLLVLSRDKNQQAKYGFPTKLGEYIASGVPTLCTDVGNISEFITDEVNGFIVEPNSPKIFADKMVSIIDNYQHSKEIASIGQKLLLREFNPNEQAKTIIEAIDQIAQD